MASDFDPQASSLNKHTPPAIDCYHPFPVLESHDSPSTGDSRQQNRTERYDIPGLLVEIIFRDGHRELERNHGTRDRCECLAKAQVTRAEVMQVVIYDPTSEYFRASES